MVCIVTGRGKKKTSSSFPMLFQMFVNSGVSEMNFFLNHIGLQRIIKWYFETPGTVTVGWSPRTCDFSLGQIKIVGQFENYFCMHICRTLGALFFFCFGRLVKMSV